MQGVFESVFESVYVNVCFRATYLGGVHALLLAHVVEQVRVRHHVQLATPTTQQLHLHDTSCYKHIHKKGYMRQVGARWKGGWVGGQR